MFVEHIGNIIEVYVVDMLVKSIKCTDHIQHLRTILYILLKFGMWLYPKKCYFGISISKSLGFLVRKHEIEANPLKIQNILKMSAPTSKDGILHLAGKLNALSRFISKLTDWCVPFFKALKQSKTLFMEWTL